MPVPKYLSLLLPDGQDAIVHVCAPDEVCVFNSRKNYTLWHEKKNQPTDPILSITFVWFLFTGGGTVGSKVRPALNRFRIHCLRDIFHGAILPKSFENGF